MDAQSPVQHFNAELWRDLGRMAANRYVFTGMPANEAARIELESGGVFEFSTPYAQAFIASFVARVRERGCDTCAVEAEFRRCSECGISGIAIDCEHHGSFVLPSAYRDDDTCGKCERARDRAAEAMEREAA